MAFLALSTIICIRKTQFPQYFMNPPFANCVSGCSVSISDESPVCGIFPGFSLLFSFSAPFVCSCYTLYSIYSNYLFTGSSIFIQTSLLIKFYIKTFLFDISSWMSCCQFSNSHCIFPVFCQFKQPNHPHVHQPNTRFIFWVFSHSFPSYACLELSKYKKCNYVKCFFPSTVAPCITLVDANR